MTTEKNAAAHATVDINAAAIDWQDLYGRIPDESLIVQFAISFVETTPELMIALQQSLKAENAAEVESNSHALKGVSANLGAIRLARAAWQLEKAGSQQRKADFAGLFQSIQTEYTCLMQFLSQDNWVEIIKQTVIH